MILLLKIVDFGKKIYTVCDEILILLAFKILQEVDLKIQNDGIHWLIRSQNFYFQIAVTFLF